MEYLENEEITSLPSNKTDIEFTECHFKNVDFEESFFTNCLFIDCKFTSCNISNSRFPGCTFRDSSFKGCKVAGINWTEASNLVSFYFDDCQINYSVFLGMKLDNFICTNSRAKNCDFSEASLKSADFSKTDLSETNFHHANCEKASFYGAIQYYIDPSVTKLKDAIFSLPEAMSLLNSFNIKIENS